ncbi:hypothetical protein KY290_027920 [Solanum tuberosum]|uniref:Uncharacterized protein n=1 Tax=Solanum tuberosum TaxID=4113 RepID=A0ABQ7UI83_SOLTU|nr:hypothetical protein KY290_027920 [Solanum tuberosum]
MMLGDTIAILRAELKSQREHVKNLKKKSLWSKTLEEVTEKLVDIVHFLHLEIHAAFGCAACLVVRGDSLILDEFLSNLLLVIRTTELEFADYAYCSILVYDVTVNLIVQLMAVSMVPFEMTAHGLVTRLESLWFHDYHSVADPCRWREIYEKQQPEVGICWSCIALCEYHHSD